MEHIKGEPFDPFRDRLPYHNHLGRLRELHDRAKRIVRSRSAEQLEEAWRDIGVMTSEYFYIERERWINWQLENGGEIFRFLAEGYRDEGGLRELIENYTSDPDIASCLDFPREEITSELEALEGSALNFELDNDSFPGATIEEYVAVLALKQIGRAVDGFYFADLDTLEGLKEDFLHLDREWFASQSMEALEAVCRAEALKELRETREAFQRRLSDTSSKIAEELAKTKVSLAAKKAAAEKHRPLREKKELILDHWDAHAEEYTSRADFARIMSALEGLKERTVYDWVTTHLKNRS